MLVCVFSTHYCTRDRGCSVHPAFPAPSLGGGGSSHAKLAQMMRRDRERVLTRRPPRLVRRSSKSEGGRRGPSIPEMLMLEPIGRGVLDRPPSRGTTASQVEMSSMTSSGRKGHLRSQMDCYASLATTARWLQQLRLLRRDRIADADAAAGDHLGIDPAIAVAEPALQRRAGSQDRARRCRDRH